jgi:hypothetical protein
MCAPVFIERIFVLLDRTLYLAVSPEYYTANNWASNHRYCFWDYQYLAQTAPQDPNAAYTLGDTWTHWDCYQRRPYLRFDHRVQSE